MARALVLRAHDSAIQLRRKLAGATDDAHKTRIRAIINLKKGATRTEIAERFVVNRDTVTDWIHAYNTGGTDALRMSKGGRPDGNPKWDRAIFDALSREIDKGGYWSVPRMMQWIRKRHGKDIPEQTVWYRMDQLKYSCKSARPCPVQGDKAKQAGFKKGSRFVRGTAEKRTVHALFR